MRGKEEKKAKEKVDEAITAIYKVNLHCEQCGRDIKKPLMSTQGVQSVDVDIGKGEIKVKGRIEVIKIHKLIEKLSKKKVELISPVFKTKDKDATASSEKVIAKETKQVIIRTSIKVHMHCDKCDKDLQKKLLKHKGIHTVKTDMKAQTLTVEGTIQSNKLLAYMKKKVHKSAEIISEKKEEKKQKEEKKEKEKVEAKSIEIDSSSKDIAEFQVEKKVQVKSKEGDIPYHYFIHYVYAPQLFSDENPNACVIM